MTTFWELDSARMLDQLLNARGNKADPVLRGVAATCPVCGVFIGMLPWLPPFRVELELFEDEWEDRVHLSGQEFLVSEAYVRLHQSKGFTGLAPFESVEVLSIKYRTKARPAPPMYFVTKVLKSDARIDDAASELKRWPGKPWCPRCGGSSETSRERLILERGTWQGEDWFEPQNLSKAIATDRVVQSIAAEGLTGWQFERCEYAKYRVHWPRDEQGNRLPL